MYTIEGVCDWCHKPRQLAKLDYIDGLCHYSCKDCFALATLDVRQFNVDELQQRERQSQHAG